MTSQSVSASTFGYTGEQTDPAGDLYLRARTYDADTGRFLSADTVQPNGPGTQGYNCYAYVANNPTTWVDPSGHAVGLIGVAAPGAGAATGVGLLPWWLPVALLLAGILIADCAAQSPLGVCNALAAMLITVFTVACVLEVGGPCWDWVDRSSSQSRDCTRATTRDASVDVVPPMATPPGRDHDPKRYPGWDEIKQLGKKYGKKCMTLNGFIYFLDTSLQHPRPHMEVWKASGRQEYKGIVSKAGGKLETDPKRSKQQRIAKETCGKG